MSKWVLGFHFSSIQLRSARFVDQIPMVPILCVHWKIHRNLVNETCASHQNIVIFNDHLETMATSSFADDTTAS
jgi:hypothetical protein